MVVEFVAVLVLTGTVIKRTTQCTKLVWALLACSNFTTEYINVYIVCWYKGINKNHYGPFWNSSSLVVELVCHWMHSLHDMDDIRQNKDGMVL